MTTMTDATQKTAEHEVIHISIPGAVELVVLARFTAATVGARAGFDLDEIDDLRLAVDELSVSFGPLDGETSLSYEFIRERDAVTVRCTREPGQAPPTEHFSEHFSESEVLNWQQARELSAQLLDELVTAHGREISRGRSVAWLIKQREAGAR